MHDSAVDLSTKRVLEAAGDMDRARAVDAGTVRKWQCSTVQYSAVQYSTALSTKYCFLHHHFIK